MERVGSKASRQLLTLRWVPTPHFPGVGAFPHANLSALHRIACNETPQSTPPIAGDPGISSRWLNRFRARQAHDGLRQWAAGAGEKLVHIDGRPGRLGSPGGRYGGRRPPSEEKTERGPHVRRRTRSRPPTCRFGRNGFAPSVTAIRRGQDRSPVADVLRTCNHTWNDRVLTRVHTEGSPVGPLISTFTISGGIPSRTDDRNCGRICAGPDRL